MASTSSYRHGLIFMSLVNDIVLLSISEYQYTGITDFPTVYILVAVNIGVCKSVSLFFPIDI